MNFFLVWSVLAVETDIRCFQLNIFLAILVDGFVTVKAMTAEENPPSMLDDLKNIWEQEFGKILKFLGKYPDFISDEELVARITGPEALNAGALRHGPAEVLSHYHRISLAPFATIKSKCGTDMNANHLFQVLRKYFPNQLVSDKHETQTHEDMMSQSVLLDPRVRNLMKSYGTVVPPPSAETKQQQNIDEFIELSRIEMMKRIAMMFHGYNHETQISMPVIEEDTNPSDKEFVLLTVIVEEARNIPKMDVFRGADVFCVVFLEGSTDIYQTEVRRGISSWIWDPELSSDFSWKLFKESDFLNPDRSLVMMVYDKDQFSSDDVIGCVKIRLGDIENGLMDGWKKVIRPPDAPKKQYYFFDVPVAELKVKVTVSDPKGQSFEGLGVQCQAALPIII
jgi:hypothetical protein